MIEIIDNHSIETSLLQKDSTVLDIGCRGFNFYKNLTNRGCKVYPVDPDFFDNEIEYYQCAISNFNGKCDLVHTQDPQAKYIKTGNVIDVYDLESFSQKVGIKEWDIIKMNCEGSEYQILPTIQRPIAKQLSLDFHEHTDRRIGKENIDIMLNRLTQWYDIKVSSWEIRHCAGYNYWDVLLILKGL